MAEQSEVSRYLRRLAIEKADQIIFIEEGQIAESGRHSDLLALPGSDARPHPMRFSEPIASAA